MKLTHIFAVAAAMAAMSTAQNATPAGTNGKQQTVATNAGAKPSTAISANSVLKVSVPVSAPAATKPANSQESATKSSVPVVTAKPAPQDAAKSKATTNASAHKPAKRRGPRVSKSSQASANGATAPASQAGESRGRRDPFVSAIRTANSSGPAAPPCATGKRCLSIPELTLHATVKDATGKMMAMVVTPSNRMYILRESDQVFNGSVVKITADSVIFREYSTDKLGHESAHEVVKKLAPSS